MQPLAFRPIGRVVSTLKEPSQAPKQGAGSGQRAWLELDPAWEQGLRGLSAGRDLWALTWLHLGGPPRMMVHPRGDASRPLTGVFNTRSPHRPNPLGLTLVRLLDIQAGPTGPRLLVEGLEAVDGTPLLDLKPYVPDLDRPPRAQGEAP